MNAASRFRKIALQYGATSTPAIPSKVTPAAGASMHGMGSAGGPAAQGGGSAYGSQGAPKSNVPYGMSGHAPPLQRKMQAPAIKKPSVKNWKQLVKAAGIEDGMRKAAGRKRGPWQRRLLEQGSAVGGLHPGSGRGRMPAHGSKRRGTKQLADAYGASKTAAEKKKTPAGTLMGLSGGLAGGLAGVIAAGRLSPRLLSRLSPTGAIVASIPVGAALGGGGALAGHRIGGAIGDAITKRKAQRDKTAALTPENILRASQIAANAFKAMSPAIATGALSGAIVSAMRADTGKGTEAVKGAVTGGLIGGLMGTGGALGAMHGREGVTAEHFRRLQAQLGAITGGVSGFYRDVPTHAQG